MPIKIIEGEKSKLFAYLSFCAFAWLRVCALDGFDAFSTFGAFGAFGACKTFS